MSLVSCLLLMLKKILDFIFPQKCIGCGTKNEILCNSCLGKINTITTQNADNVFAVSNYNDPVTKKAINLLKYRGVKAVSERLADLIYISFLKETSLKKKLNNSIITPIPLSNTRMRERGFNQSELLARHFVSKIKDDKGNNKNMSVTLHTNVLYKKFHTSAQVKTKNREERLSNLKGSFIVKNTEIIKNKIVIVIDDVLTTGATMREARKVLTQAGAKEVVGLVVARGGANFYPVSTNSNCS